MSITERTVKNKRNSAGILTGKPGVVYDVNVKYRSEGKLKAHTKKGFATKSEAQQYEAMMKNKLANPSYYTSWQSDWGEMRICAPVPKPAIKAIFATTSIPLSEMYTWGS